MLATRPMTRPETLITKLSILHHANGTSVKANHDDTCILDQHMSDHGPSTRGYCVLSEGIAIVHSMLTNPPSHFPEPPHQTLSWEPLNCFELEASHTYS
jgi:hypothetical protein